MIRVIGQLGCSNCEITKLILKKKGVDFTYQLITDLSEIEQDELFNMAEIAKKTNMPMILKDNEFTDISEL